MIVKVYSTQSGEKQIETNAQTWGEFKRDLDNNSIIHDKMKCVIGESKLTLEADAAILPASGFTLFLMQKKTKAGTDTKKMSYRELRSTIQNILHNDEDAKDHFNKGKNYTTKSTEVLRELLLSYESGEEIEEEGELEIELKDEVDEVEFVVGVEGEPEIMPTSSKTPVEKEKPSEMTTLDKVREELYIGCMKLIHTLYLSSKENFKESQLHMFRVNIADINRHTNDLEKNIAYFSKKNREEISIDRDLKDGFKDILGMFSDVV